MSNVNTRKLNMRLSCYIRTTRVPERSPTAYCADCPDGAEPAELCGSQRAVCRTAAGAGRVPRLQRKDRAADQRVSWLLHDRRTLRGAAGGSLFTQTDHRSGSDLLERAH